MLEATVLRHIRDRPGLTARELSDELGIVLERPVSSDVIGSVYLREVLNTLQSANLVMLSGKAPDFRYRIADWWAPVQRVLNISLSELAKRQTGEALLVEPIFGPIEPGHTQGRPAFVIMPFQSAFDPVYEAVRAALASCQLNPARADGLQSSRPGAAIMQEIWAGIWGAHFVIADCTGGNTNVAYELGIAHTIGRPVLLLAQTKEDLAFDIGHRRAIFYDPSKAGLERLGVEIKKAVKKYRSKPQTQP